MTAHEQALQRLRTLLVAQNALAIAVEEATQEVLRTAEIEGAITLVESQRSPMESGVRPKAIFAPAEDMTMARATTSSADHERATRAVMRRIGSSDVERYIIQKWNTAATDEERNRVRSMVLSSAESGSLDADGVERMRVLTTAA